jgi:hypothetical protein
MKKVTGAAELVSNQAPFEGPGGFSLFLNLIFICMNKTQCSQFDVAPLFYSDRLIYQIK